jgi:phosphoketolase
MTVRPAPLDIFDRLEDLLPTESDPLHVDSQGSANGDGVDVQFVEEYERLFDSFLHTKPELADRNPELMEYLKVIKLQKILEASTEMEKELQQHIKEAQQRKDDTAQTYQIQLLEASRLKTVREALVKEQLDAAHQRMQVMQVNQTWQSIEATHARAQRQQDIILHLMDQREETRDVLSLLPDLPETNRLQTLLKAPSDVPERNIIQYQVEKSFLQSEAVILETKTQHLFSEAKKHAWVDGVLLQLKQEELVQFKEVYYKQMGVQP